MKATGWMAHMNRYEEGVGGRGWDGVLDVTFNSGSPALEAWRREYAILCRMGGSRWSSMLLRRLVIFWRYCNVACRPSTRSHLAIHRLCDCPPTCRFVAKLTNTSSICLMRAQQGGILLCCTDFYSGARIGSKAAPKPSRSAKIRMDQGSDFECVSQACVSWACISWALVSQACPCTCTLSSTGSTSCGLGSL